MNADLTINVKTLGFDVAGEGDDRTCTMRFCVVLVDQNTGDPVDGPTMTVDMTAEYRSALVSFRDAFGVSP